MGANQQRPCEVELTIERNLKNIQKQMFDFTREREVLTRHKIAYPSYLHHYEKNNELAYSLLEDPRNNVFRLNADSIFSNEVHLQLAERDSRASVWKVVSENKECEIEQGDRIRIGRVELYFKQLRSLNCKKSLRQIEEDTSHLKPSSRASQDVLKNSGFYGKYQRTQMRETGMLSMKQSDFMANSMVNSMAYSRVSGHETSCRICFDTANSSANPLFNICNCSGSVKYVHYECMKNWFKSKTVRFQTAHCIYYHYEPMQCDLCRYAISNEVIYQGRKYNLYEYERIHPPYAKFEHYSDNKIFEILIRLEESLSIVIGRGVENDLNLNDSSISRSHCSLFYSASRMMLKGLPSKYGTFIELASNFELKQREPLQLMVSNYLLSLSKKEEEGQLLRNECCSGPQSIIVIVE